MKVLLEIIKLPISFIILIYSLYVTYRITMESEIFDLDDIETEEEFDDVLKPFVDKFVNEYEILLNTFNIIFWLTILKILLF